MNILDIAIAKKLAGGGGGSGTDNYNDLSNLPKINDTTLSGNKSSSALGLQSEINSDSKLASDLVDDTNQDNKFVTSTEKNTWNGKQNAIDADHKINADYVDDSTSTNKFVTASDKETWNAKQNAIDNSHKLSSDLVDDADHTNKFVTSTEKQTWNAKQNAIDADHKLSSSLVSFTDAEAAALASGIDSSKVGQISTNQTNILYAINTGVKNLFNPNNVDDLTNLSEGVNGYTYQSTQTDSRATVVLVLLAYNGSTLVEQLHQESITNTGVFAITFRKTSAFNRLVIGHSGTVNDLKLGFNVSNLKNDTDYIISINITEVNPSVLFAWTDTMICTAEIYAQSHEFDEYALPNNSLTAGLIDAIDNGAKNLIDLSDLDAIKALNTYGSWKGNVYTYDNATTFTFNEDGTIGVATVGTIQSQAVCNLIVSTTLINGEEYVISGCPAGGSSGATNGYMLDYQYNRGGSVYYILDTGDGARFNYSSSDSVVKLLIIIRPQTKISSGLVFKPMICTLADWNVSQNFAPYALPNYDLTRLEAEDRAALAEEIDAGAKNIANLKSTTNLTVNSNGYTITATGTPSSSSTQWVWEGTVSKAGNYVFAIKSTSGTLPTTVLYNATDDTNVAIYSSGTGGETVVYLTAGKTYKIGSYLHSGTTYNAAYDCMLATKAAFGVSPKFVPFGTDPFYQVPINHNMIYRGRNLGASLTDAQHTALSSGNFTDLYLGDYWTKQITIPAFYEVTAAEPADWSTNYTSYYTKSGDTYTPITGDTAPTWAANTYYERLVPSQTVTLKAVIADFDTFYAGYASSYAGINTHHAAVIVTGFNNVVWNKTNTTAGGYANSLIHKWLVNSALPQIETWFGAAKVLSHQKLLTNAITGDAASGWAWSSQKISLLSENQMYGSKVWGNSKAANGGYEPGEAFKHLNVFNHIDANLLFGNKNIWLRDIASAVWAANLSNGGYAGNGDASYAWVAPAALILLS